MSDVDVPFSSVTWNPCWRIIPSRFPPIQLFERVADPKDLDAIFALESLTNDRLRDEMGDLKLVPQEQRITGAGASYIMAAFTHPNPDGSRYSDGTYGVYYTAAQLATAIAETKHHRAVFLRYTNENPIEIDMQVLRATLNSGLHDMRECKKAFPHCYTSSYDRSQDFAKTLKGLNSPGIAYQSIRCDDQGDCAAIFHPNVLSDCQQDHRLCYVWDGCDITDIYKKKPLQ